MKKFKFSLSFLLTLFSLEGLLWLLDWPGKIVFIVLIPFAFSIYQMIHFFKSLFKKNYTLALQSILISILIIGIPIKFNFIYYNLFFHCLILIGSGIIFYINRKSENISILHKNRNVLLPFIVIGSYLLLIDDKTVLKVIHMERHVPFGFTDITWDDFKGVPTYEKVKLGDTTVLVDAQINSTFYYKINKVYNYPQIISISAMSPIDSWTRSSNKHLLNHERAHFFISEYYSQKVNSLDSTWPNNSDTINKKILLFYDSLNIMQKRFDDETYHGTNRGKEIFWEKKISKLINE